jgi:hypothetical protein
MLYATGARSGQTLDVTVPQSATNGSGLDTTAQNAFFPLITAKTTVGGGNINASLLLYNNASGGSNYNVFRIGTLGTPSSALVRMVF